MVARAIEAQVLVAQLGGWLTQLRTTLPKAISPSPNHAVEPGFWPAEALGWSLGEAPGGAVGHWVRIKDARIETYQIVDASTWNGSPRDGKGLRGAWEEALIGTPVADPARPLEILRTVHSFDPCTACGVHVYRPATSAGRSTSGSPGEVPDDRPPETRPAGRSAAARRGRRRAAPDGARSASTSGRSRSGSRTG